MQDTEQSYENGAFVVIAAGQLHETLNGFFFSVAAAWLL